MNRIIYFSLTNIITIVQSTNYWTRLADNFVRTIRPSLRILLQQNEGFKSMLQAVLIQLGFEYLMHRGYDTVNGIYVKQTKSIT